jgi:hypothetical protein
MNTNCINTEDFQCNTIKETVIKIDRLQKAVVTNTAGTCVTCETSLLSSNNTIPVSFTTCCGNRICGLIGTTGATTCFYRIESVRCGKYVTVRLLETTGGALEATPYTMIIDLDCVAMLQCFEAISIVVCSQSTPE